MRKACAQAGDSLVVTYPSFGILVFTSEFIHFTASFLPARYSQFGSFCSQLLGACFSDVSEKLSNLSTHIIITTTFCLNRSLITTRGIS